MLRHRKTDIVHHALWTHDTAESGLEQSVEEDGRHRDISPGIRLHLQCSLYNPARHHLCYGNSAGCREVAGLENLMCCSNVHEKDILVLN